MKWNTIHCTTYEGYKIYLFWRLVSSRVSSKLNFGVFSSIYSIHSQLPYIQIQEEANSITMTYLTKIKWTLLISKGTSQKCVCEVHLKKSYNLRKNIKLKKFLNWIRFNVLGFERSQYLKYIWHHEYIKDEKCYQANEADECNFLFFSSKEIDQEFGFFARMKMDSYLLSHGSQSVSISWG